MSFEGTFASSKTLDIPRARKVLEHLVAHPEEHDQNTFGRKEACGTTMCVAGTTVFQEPTCAIQWVEGSMSLGGCNSIALKAKDLLGLSFNEAHWLFFYTTNEQALALLRAHIESAEKVQAQ